MRGDNLFRNRHSHGAPSVPARFPCIARLQQGIIALCFWSGNAACSMKMREYRISNKEFRMTNKNKSEKQGLARGFIALPVPAFHTIFVFIRVHSWFRL
jgi:hypothetical protein